MILRSLDIHAYHTLFGKGAGAHTFVSESFIQHVRPNARQVVCLAFVSDDRATGIGIVVGLVGGEWRAPFSAPYGGIQTFGDVTVADITDFVSEAQHYLGAPLSIVLPPAFHNPAHTHTLLSGLTPVATSIITDKSFHIALSDIDNYMDAIPSVGRRNLKRALGRNYALLPTTDLEGVYNMIADHHKRLGYHMAMTLEQVRDTLPLVGGRCFYLTLDGTPVGATYIYDVRPGTAQLINWGNIEGLNEWRPMNAFAYLLLKHYSAEGYQYFDFGPASTDGIDNEGLCRFKTSIGCTATPKHKIVIA